jgi:ribonucleoside-diphosphate reductase alpha chain
LISKIRKREGDIVTFDRKKIVKAILKAVKEVNGDVNSVPEISNKVVRSLEKKYSKNLIPRIGDVQDIVEVSLMDAGMVDVAKAYILYRQKRRELREAKSSIGVVDELKLSYNAVKTLQMRYLLRDDSNSVIESTSQLFRRVAKAISNGDGEVHEDEFFSVMANTKFLPNSPTMMNAGTGRGTLSACFVLPIEDNLKSIMTTASQMAYILQFGGGTGFNFSRLRHKGSPISSTHGRACGPVAVLKHYNSVSNLITQGGKREGANMGILRVDHPDIVEFIDFKREDIHTNDMFRCFNTSVWITDDFMKRVKKDEDYILTDATGIEVCESARRIYEMILMGAWRDGNPGVIFGDTINKRNSLKDLDEIEATNPCAEQPLLPYESCNLGSINLSKFVDSREIDEESLITTVGTGVRFLDGVIDVNKYPIKAIEDLTKENRKIGLGIMGFADLLLRLRVRYDSNEGLKIAERLMKLVSDTALETSIALGEEKGSFPNIDKSTFKTPMRNATLTTIAPTGTLSILGDCSQSIEPLFAVAYKRRVLGQELLEINPTFESIAREEGFYSEDLLRKVSSALSIQEIKDIPKSIRRIFVTAHDISPDWHVKMQAAFQKYVDNAVSKTVNLPSNTGTDDVRKVFDLAHKLGCKGITVYRDKSRNNQVLDTCESGVCEL